MSAVANLGRVVPSISSLFPKYTPTTVTTSTGSGIISSIQNFFKGISPATKTVVTQVTKKPTIPSTIKGISGNVAITGGTILGTTALLSLTQGGQNLVTTTGESVGNITNLGQSVNELFSKNPILPIGLLILGGLIVVSVIKK